MICELHSPQWKNILRTNQLKATPAREKVLDAFKHAGTPLSIKLLGAALNDTGIDKATLYRNLESLSSAGVLRKIRLADREIFYELSGEHHHHITCKKCGKIADVPECNIAIQKNKLLKKSGFAQVDDHSLEFFGICRECFTPC